MLKVAATIREKTAQPNQAQYVESPWNQLGNNWNYQQAGASQLDGYYQQHQQHHQPQQQEQQHYGYSQTNSFTASNNQYHQGNDWSNPDGHQRKQVNQAYDYSTQQPFQSPNVGQFQQPATMLNANSFYQGSQADEQNQTYFSSAQHQDHNIHHYHHQQQQPSLQQHLQPQQQQQESSIYKPSAFVAYHQSSPSPQPTSVFQSVAGNVGGYSSIGDSFLPTPKEHTPQPVEQTLSDASASGGKSVDVKEASVENAAASDRRWSSWGDDADLDLDESTVGAFYGKDDDEDGYNFVANGPETASTAADVERAPSVVFVAAPDLVATSNRSGGQQNATDNVRSEPEKRSNRRPPDLFSGHDEHSVYRNDPDIVSSRFDAAQSDVLQDVSLETVHDFERANNNGLARTVSKWGQKIIDTLAPESESGDADSRTLQDLHNQSAVLSLAGMAFHNQPSQQRSRSGSSASATSPKLELLTYSYYEADVPRSAGSELKESSEETGFVANEISEDGGATTTEQLPEADMARVGGANVDGTSAEILQKVQKNDFYSTNNNVARASASLPDNNNFASPVVDTISKSRDVGAESEDNWSMMNNVGDYSKLDLTQPARNNINANESASSWNQWGDEEEDEGDRDSPENLEISSVKHNPAMSDWRPESERDDVVEQQLQQQQQLSRHENRNNGVAVEQWLEDRPEVEGSEVILQVVPSKQFEITVNEPVSIAPESQHPVQSAAASSDVQSKSQQQQQPVVAENEQQQQPAPSTEKVLASKETFSKSDTRSFTGGAQNDRASMWSVMSNVDEKSVQDLTVGDDQERISPLSGTLVSKATSSGTFQFQQQQKPPLETDRLLIDRFIRDANRLDNSNTTSKSSSTLRRGDSSLWSTTANPDVELPPMPAMPPSHTSPAKHQLPPLPAATRVKRDSTSSQDSSSVLSVTRKAMQQNVGNKDEPELSKKRRESLHKRYKEARQKSHEIFARLNVSLLNTTVESAVPGKLAPVIIVPSATSHLAPSFVRETPQPSPAKELLAKSLKAQSTPLPTTLPPTRNVAAPKAAPVVPKHDDASYDEDERYYDRRDRHGRNERRPYSRASERDDRRYRKPDYGRNRPHSTQGFDSEDEDDSGDYEDDEMKDYYRRWRYYHDGNKRRTPQQYSSGWGMASSRSFYNQVQMDPAWQKYLYEFYCLRGYYPTYEQLHRMWTDQQQSAASRMNTSVANAATDQLLLKHSKLKTSKTASGSQLIAQPLSLNLKRTEEYVAGQQQHLFSDEKESELSASRADSERSFDVPSSVSAIEPYHLQVPHKHSVTHAVCRFGVGGHLAIVTGSSRLSGQRQTVVEIRHVRNLIKNDAEIDENVEKIDAFCGPLSTHTDKSVLIQFCQKKAEKYRHDLSVIDRESAILLWNFLVCLIRQNGAIGGSDLARLLMDGREFRDSSVIEVEQDLTSRRSKRDDDDDDYYENHAAGYDRSFVSCATQTIDRVEQHFRDLLLGGTKKEALDWAVKHKLWGHALFLAMKIDQRTHTNVMIRFANSLALNDPLQTLYQMMSGVMPYASTQLSDDKWGDWHAHLAIILSNLSLVNGVAADPAAFEREMSSVLTLGNTLMDDGRTYAAQFCYLCCHILGGWDVFTVQQRRHYITLLGAHSELKKDEIFTIDRIQMTEIYEYAVSLLYAQTKQTFCLPTIQIYKLRYALQLAEFGFAEDAYKYCALLNATIQQTPNLYTFPMVCVIVDLATKLQRFDSTMENLNFDYHSTQPALAQWITELSLIAQGLKEGSIVPLHWQQQQHLQPNDQYQSNTSSSDQQQKLFTIGQPEEQQRTEQAPTTSLAYSHEQPRANFVTDMNSRRNSTQRSSISGNASRDVSTVKDVVDAVESGSRRMSSSVASSPRHSVGRERLSSVVDDQIDEINTNAVVAPPVGRPVEPRTYAEVATPLPTSITDEQQLGSDYYGGYVQGNNPDGTPDYYYGRMPFPSNQSRNNAQSSADSLTPSPYQQRPYSTSTEAGGAASDNVFTPSPPSVKVNAKTAVHPAGGQPKTVAHSKSWLVGVLRKVLPKDPKEMILPDDKTKSIIWDDKNGRWKNLDGDGNDDVPPPPPPSLAASNANIITNQVSSVAQQHLVEAVNAALPTTAPVPPVKPVNRFASQGKRYASINAFSGGTVASTPSTASSLPPPFMVPTSGPVGGSAKTPYFVPQAMNSDSNDSYPSVDPFSTAEPVPSSTTASRQ